MLTTPEITLNLTMHGIPQFSIIKQLNEE